MLHLLIKINLLHLIQKFSKLISIPGQYSTCLHLHLLKHWWCISQCISPQTVYMTHVTEMPAAHFSNSLKHQMVIWAVSNHPKISDVAETVGVFTNGYRELLKWHVYDGLMRKLGSPGISHQQTIDRPCKQNNKLQHLILKSCCQDVLLQDTCAVFISCQLLHLSCRLGEKKKIFCQPDIINFKKGIFLDLMSPSWCHRLIMQVQTGRQCSILW